MGPSPSVQRSPQFLKALPALSISWLQYRGGSSTWFCLCVEVELIIHQPAYTGPKWWEKPQSTPRCMLLSLSRGQLLDPQPLQVTVQPEVTPQGTGIMGACMGCAESLRLPECRPVQNYTHPPHHYVLHLQLVLYFQFSKYLQYVKNLSESFLNSTFLAFCRKEKVPEMVKLKLVSRIIFYSRLGQIPHQLKTDLFLIYLLGKDGIFHFLLCSNQGSSLSVLARAPNKKSQLPKATKMSICCNWLSARLKFSNVKG